MKKKSRLGFLDYITVIGLILIVFAHIKILSTYLETPLSNTIPLSFGIIGNLLLFFRSGFGIYTSEKSSWFLFFKNRFFRVIPVLFLTTTIIMLAALLLFDLLKLDFDGRLNFKTFVANAFGIQEFFNILRINPITWFISYLLIFYLIFPVLYKLISKNPSNFFIAYLMIFLLAFFVSNIQGYSYLPKIS